jgi:hypothetical protein
MAQKANLDVSERLDISCKRGDSFELFLNLKDSAGENLPLLTDEYEFIIQVKTPNAQQQLPNQVSTTPQTRTLIAASALNESETKGVSETKQADAPIFTFGEIDDLGNVVLKATADSTSRLPVGRFVYDLQYKVLVNGFSKVTTILRGNFTVKEDISTAV